MALKVLFHFVALKQLFLVHAGVDDVMAVEFCFSETVCRRVQL